MTPRPVLSPRWSSKPVLWLADSLCLFALAAAIVAFQTYCEKG